MYVYVYVAPIAIVASYIHACRLAFCVTPVLVTGYTVKMKCSYHTKWCACDNDIVGVLITHNEDD